MIPVYDLITRGPRAAGPPGIVYSCAPERAECLEGSFIIKGPETATVFAELLGCELARAVGLPVPPTAVCREGAETYAGSELLRDCARNAEPWIRGPVGSSLSNFGDLFDAVIVDGWLCNADRNINNVLIQVTSGQPPKAFFIDFEKSLALRGPHPIMNSAAIADEKLWPPGILGELLRDRRGLHPGGAVQQRIREMQRHQIEEIVNDVAHRLGGVPWSSSVVEALCQRGARIHRLAVALWR